MAEVDEVKPLRTYVAHVVGTVYRTVIVLARDEETARLHAEQELKMITGASLPEVIEIEDLEIEVEEFEDERG